MKVPFATMKYMHADIKDEMMKKIEEIYDKGMYILGEEVEKFEEELDSFYNIMESCVQNELINV